MFGRQAGAGARAASASPLTRAARADLYGDAVNEARVHAARPVPHPAARLLRQPGASTAPSTARPRLIGGLSSRSPALQTGFARSYALSMLGGAALVVAALVLVRL